MSLIIDLDFAGLMNAKELQSTCVQMGLVYSATKKSNLETCFVGFGNEIKENLKKSYPTFEKWNIEFIGDALESFNPDNLVYLTGDSEFELDDLSPSEVYVIGGIVDHNRYKNICLNKAVKLGIRHARLPISKYLNLNSRSILTINQVVDILAVYLNTKDWKIAFETCIPQRKRLESQR